MGPLQLDPNLTPAGTPPDGIIPNFVDPPSMSDAYRGIIYTFVPLMFIFLLSRLFIRTRMQHVFGLDDVFCILGTASIVSYSGVLIPLLDKPLGRHLWDVPIAHITNRYLEFSTVLLVLFFLGAMFVKLTLLVLYLHLFKIHRLASCLIWGGAAVVTLFYSISIIVLLEACVPRSGHDWLETTFTGSCTPVQNGLSKGSGVFGLISDLYILAIPLWLISQLTLRLNRKLGVMAVFLTGLIACGFSAGGLAMRFTWKQNDGTWSMLYIFGILEITIGNICACMPIMTPLLRKAAGNSADFWQKVNRYYYSLRSRPSNKPGSNGSETADIGNAMNEKLPGVPRGTVTGLQTFIRGGPRSDTEETELRTDGLGTLSSENDDYHVQVKTLFLHDVERRAGSEAAESTGGGSSHGPVPTEPRTGL